MFNFSRPITIILFFYFLFNIPFLLHSFAGGNGTENDPYQIETIEDLNAVRYHLTSKHFMLNNDIDASETENWNDGQGWEPIGTFSNPFTGVFDGNNFEISNLNINRENQDNIGLFGVVSYALFKNLVLQDFNMSGHKYVANLIGYSSYSKVNNIHSSGDIVGVEQVGGIIGSSRFDRVQNLMNYSNITGEIKCGGIIGSLFNSVIIQSINFSDLVQGNYFVGGITSSMTKSTMMQCGNKSDVVGVSNIGGLVGANFENDIIYSCYSSGAIQGISNIGGMLGKSNDKLDIFSKNYTISTVSGDYNIGRAIGNLEYYPLNERSNLILISEFPQVGNYPTVTCYLNATMQQLEDEEFLRQHGWKFSSNSTNYVWKMDAGQVHSPPYLACETETNQIFQIGDGSEENPFQIYDKEDMINIDLYLDKCFIQMQDISLYDSEYYLFYRWIPLGKKTFFSGKYNGQDYTIQNLTLNSTESYCGLFSSLENAEVKNVIFENCNIQGGFYVGALAGKTYSSTVRNIQVEGTINGENNVGSIIGFANNSSIMNIHSEGIVEGNEKVGGCFGWTLNSEVNYVKSYTTVAGQDYVGGIVGEGTYLNYCINYGEIFGDEYVGGIAGLGGDIYYSGNKGSITANERVGGILGQNFPDLDIRNCYNIGSIHYNNYPYCHGGILGRADGLSVLFYCYASSDMSYESAGGLVGLKYNNYILNIRHSLWNKDLNPTLSTVGFNEGYTESESTTSAMTQQTTYTNLNWDFSSDFSAGTWSIDTSINDGFPYLTWERDPSQYFENGLGTEYNPFLVSTPEELNNVRYFLNSHFLQTNDIDLSNWNNGQDWVPIGSNSHRFSGKYNGRNFKIINLSINRPEENYQALFSHIENATIKNIVIENADVIGNGSAGILISDSRYSHIENIVASGSAAGGVFTGGVIAFSSYSEIINVFNYAMVNGSMFTGGIIGRSSNDRINACGNYGNISGNIAGGVCGGVYSNSSTFASLFNEGNITAIDYCVGGIFGKLDLYDPQYAKLSKLYNTGNVIGINDVGGIAGRLFIETDILIEESYVAGNIQGNSNVGTFCGLKSSEVYGDILNTAQFFWDSQLTEIDQVIGNDDAYSFGIPVETTQLQNQIFLEGYDWGFSEDGGEWNFNANINSGYPILNFELQHFGSTIFENGNGTIEDPFQISTLQQLDKSRNFLGFHFILVNDIDASETETWNNGLGWEPIGSYVHPFKGSLDGNNFKISNLNINRPTQDYCGLFASIKEASLYSLDIENSFIIGQDRTGTIAGNVRNSSISHCFVQGSIQGREYTAGIAGEAQYSTFFALFCEGVVNGSNYTGGLIGKAENSYLRYLKNSVSVRGTGNFFGGIVGEIEGSELSLSKNRGNIAVLGEFVGGICGSIHSSNVDNCLNNVLVSGNSIVGGIAGRIALSSSLANCYNYDFVNGFSTTGVIAGILYESSSSQNCFWFSEDENDLPTGNGAFTESFTEVNTLQMHQIDTYLEAGWDFINESVNGNYDYWTMSDDDLPDLNWEELNDFSFFPAGDGSISDPYQITTLLEFNKMRFFPTKSYTLMNDIDASDTENWNNGNGFTPINTIFSGTLNGNSHSIHNLHIETESERSVAIYTSLHNATIQDISFVNAYISGRKDCAVIAVHSNDSDFNNCTISGTIEGHDYIGGFVVEDFGSNFIACSTENLNIKVSYHEFDETTLERFGGFISKAKNSEFVRCRSTGSIIGNHTGGFVYESTDYIRFENCYNSTYVSASTIGAGFSAIVDNISIINSYNDGIIFSYSENDPFGGFTGEINGETIEIENSYYIPEYIIHINDLEPTDIGETISQNQLITMSSFNNWDFENSWHFIEGFRPYLGTEKILVQPNFFDENNQNDITLNTFNIYSLSESLGIREILIDLKFTDQLKAYGITNFDFNTILSEGHNTLPINKSCVILPSDYLVYASITDNLGNEIQSAPYLITYNETFASGSGTENNPYHIQTPNQFNMIRMDCDAHYILDTDLDFADLIFFTDSKLNKGWTPIKRDSYGLDFIGSLDGLNHTLLNLYSDSYSGSSVFRNLFEAKIENLVISNASFSKNCIAGLAQDALNSEIKNVHILDSNFEASNVTFGFLVSSVLGNTIIENCSSNSTAELMPVVIINNYVATSQAGLIGEIEVSQGNQINISDCHFSGEILGNGRSSIGGILGNSRIFYEETEYNNIIIENCSNTGALNSNYIAGGLVGSINHLLDPTSSIHISDSFSTATLNGQVVGGIIGDARSSNISVERCYSRGTLSASDVIGGFVGRNKDGLQISNSYTSTVAESYTDSLGAIIGNNEGLLLAQNVYYNADYITNSGVETNDIIGCTTQELQNYDTYNFEFYPEYEDAHWSLNPWDNNAMPFLTWEGFTPYLKKPNLILNQVTLNDNWDVGTSFTINELGIPSASQVGICWSENENPTMSDNFVLVENVNLGAYEEILPDLSPNHIYRVRAFAVNDFETIYSNEKTIIVYAMPPTISASGIEVSDIYANQATVNWTRGNGSECVVFVCEGYDENVPTIQNGMSYIANPEFGYGSEIERQRNTLRNETNWFCVYNGTEEDITISGLDHDKTYTIAIAEQNGSNGYQSYFLESSAENSMQFNTNEIDQNSFFVLGNGFKDSETCTIEMTEDEPSNIDILFRSQFNTSGFSWQIQNQESCVVTANRSVTENQKNYTILTPENYVGIAAFELFVSNEFEGQVLNVQLNVENVNDRPILLDGSFSIPLMDGDIENNVGARISDIVPVSAFSEVDPTFEPSILITNWNEEEGQVQYSIDQENWISIPTLSTRSDDFLTSSQSSLKDFEKVPITNFSDENYSNRISNNTRMSSRTSYQTGRDLKRFSSTSTEQGFALPHNYYIRFIPNGLWYGTTDIVFKAWDESAGNELEWNPLSGTFYSEETETISASLTTQNDAPDIVLQNLSLSEMLPLNSVIATLSVDDPDDRSIYSYELVQGTGDTNNADFIIENNELKTNRIFDYEALESVSIRMKVIDDDIAGLVSKEQILTFEIEDKTDVDRIEFTGQIPHDLEINEFVIFENTTVQENVNLVVNSDFSVRHSGLTILGHMINSASENDRRFVQTENAPARYENIAKQGLRYKSTNMSSRTSFQTGRDLKDFSSLRSVEMTKIENIKYETSRSCHPEPVEGRDDSSSSRSPRFGEENHLSTKLLPRDTNDFGTLYIQTPVNLSFFDFENVDLQINNSNLIMHDSTVENGAIFVQNSGINITESEFSQLANGLELNNNFGKFKRNEIHHSDIALNLSGTNPVIYNSMILHNDIAFKIEASAMVYVQNNTIVGNEIVLSERINSVRIAKQQLRNKSSKLSSRTSSQTGRDLKDFSSLRSVEMTKIENIKFETSRSCHPEPVEGRDDSSSSRNYRSDNKDLTNLVTKPQLRDGIRNGNHHFIGTIFADFTTFSDASNEDIFTLLSSFNFTSCISNAQLDAEYSFSNSDLIVEEIPIFTDAENGHYQLNPNSRAINRMGASLSDKSEIDFAGNPRVYNDYLVDCGALEMQYDPIEIRENIVTELQFNEDEFLPIDWNNYFDLPAQENLDGVEFSVQTTEHMGFENGILSADENWFGDGQLVVNATDMYGRSRSILCTVEVSPVNDLPIVANPIQMQEIMEDFGSLKLDLSTLFTDVENDECTVFLGNFDSYRVQAEIVQDSLFLESIENMCGEQIIEIRCSDNVHQGFASFELQLDILPINDAPEITSPASIASFEDESFVFENEKKIELFDVDVYDDVSQTYYFLVSLITAEGGLYLTPTDGVQIITGTGNNDDYMVLAGSIFELNNALETLVYAPQENFFGQDSLSILLDDQGSHGAGDLLTASQTIAIDIAPVNDDPLMSFPATMTFAEDDSLTIYLPDYVHDIDNHFNELEFSWIGNQHLELDVQDSLLVVRTNEQHWNGENTILFTASDSQNNVARRNRRRSQSQNIQFVVSPVNDLPAQIQDFEAIVQEEDFQTVFFYDLNDYFAEYDGETLEYEITQEEQLVRTNLRENMLYISSLLNRNGTTSLTIKAKDNADENSFIEVEIPVEIESVYDAPDILGYLPNNNSLTLDLFDVQRFEVDVIVEEDDVDFRWYLNDTEMLTDSLYYDYVANEEGVHFLRFEMEYENVRITNEWTVYTIYRSAEIGEIPAVTNFGKCYPNPFQQHKATRSGLTLQFGLHEDSNTQIKAYNIRGQEVATILNSKLGAGQYEHRWNAKSNQNKALPSGMYFIQMKTDSFEKIQKIMILK